MSEIRDRGPLAGLMSRVGVSRSHPTESVARACRSTRLRGILCAMSDALTKSLLVALVASLLPALLASLLPAPLAGQGVEELSRACEERNRWEFMLVISPLRLSNVTGSPVNPIAVF